MIDLYYWTTPNGHKITIFLEEAQLEAGCRDRKESRGTPSGGPPERRNPPCS